MTPLQFFILEFEVSRKRITRIIVNGPENRIVAILPARESNLVSVYMSTKLRKAFRHSDSINQVGMQKNSIKHPPINRHKHVRYPVFPKSFCTLVKRLSIYVLADVLTAERIPRRF